MSEIDFTGLSDDSDSVIPFRSVFMPEKTSTAFKLVPEIALLEPLPEHLQKRFSHALKLMHEELAEHKSWEQIATESAISPFHFHRQFTALFHETPGQYQGRVRLQVAVSLLMSDEPWSVMEIAQYCGFSSSQALGKALKRELGVTAKYVRKMRFESTPRETGEFIARLAHPGPQDTLENQLAKTMPSELIWYPRRGMKKIPLKDPDWDAVLEAYAEKSVRLLGATPINQLENTWDQIETFIGDWQVNEALYDFVIPEGYYLCADVYVVSDVGYGAALDALFEAAEQQQLEIDPDAYLIEMVRDIEFETTEEAVTFSFQLPVIPGDGAAA